jgi:hypothetical protein
MTDAPIRRAALVSAALLALAGCQSDDGLGGLFAPASDADAPILDTGGEPSPPAVPAGPVSVDVPTVAGETEWGGVLSAGAADMRVTARSPRDWDILWQLIGRAAPGPLPEGAMAVAVFLGTRPTAGYSVEIIEAVEGPDQVTVRWRERTPAPGSLGAQVVTAPWAVRLVPATDRPVGYLRVP